MVKSHKNTDYYHYSWSPITVERSALMTNAFNGLPPSLSFPLSIPNLTSFPKLLIQSPFLPAPS